MFKQASHDNDIRRVMDACLPGLENKPDFERDVFRQVRGEVKVKKKLSVGFVLVIVLALAAVTALAMTLNAYYEKTIEKEGQSGLIQDWSAADKVALVDWMVEAGIELDEDKVAQLHTDDLSEDARSTLAMEIIGDYYPARDGILTSVDIIAKEKGPIEHWSLEDKAWFSEMIAKYQPEEVSSVNLLPTAEDITQEQAIEIMYAYYEKEYGLKREDFDESKMTISFSEGTWDDGSGPERLKTWGMDLWLKADTEHPMAIYILPDGTVKQASGPYVTGWYDDWYNTSMAEDFWTIEGLHKFKQEWKPRVAALLANGEKISQDLQYLTALPFELPKESDISRDEAYELARATILGTGFDDKYLQLYGTREAYLVNTDGYGYYKFCFTYWVYSLSDEKRTEAEQLHEQETIPHKFIVCVNAADGQVISIDANDDVDGIARLGI